MTNRKELLNTLELVKPGLSNKPLVPVFLCYCFTGETVYAYNDSLGIVAPCNEDVVAGVQGERLLGLLSNSRGKDVTFTLNENKHEALIKTGSSRIKLPYFTGDEFLFDEPDEEWETVLSLTNEIRDAFSCCLTTVGDDLAQKGYMGITIINDPENEFCCFYSCNGDALTRYVAAAADEGQGQYIMPSEFCLALLKMIDKLKDELEETFGVLMINNEWAKAELTTGHVIYGRIIEPDKQEDFDELIDNNLPEDIAFVDIPKGLDQALSRAIIMVDKNTWKTQLTMDKDKLCLYTEADDGGEIRDRVKMVDGYEDIDIFVNAESMQRSVGLCEQFAMSDKCTAYSRGEYLLQILGNVD